MFVRLVINDSPKASLNAALKETSLLYNLAYLHLQYFVKLLFVLLLNNLVHLSRLEIVPENKSILTLLYSNNNSR